MAMDADMTMFFFLVLLIAVPFGFLIEDFVSENYVTKFRENQVVK
jgi:hypothetical protein